LGRLFPFIAVLQDQNDVANDIAQSEKLHPSHRNHSLPGAGFDRRIQNMYPFQCTLLMIIAHPAEYCQDSKTEKNAGLPLDKPEKNAYNKNRKSIPVDGCSHVGD
jgi:hypothetical protein